jgi:hypothetical protein
MKTTFVTTVLAISMAISVRGQTMRTASARTYDVEDAYQIYSLLLPHEESYSAPGTLIIEEETASRPELAQPCVTPEAARQFKGAIAAYSRVNRVQWLLQRQFWVSKAYEIVSSDTIRVLFNEEDWDGFYKRYPDSGGYVVMSAVGFNEENTRAIVFTGTFCGNRCGRWGFHLLEKIQGNWKEVPGVTCVTVS